MTAVWLIMSFRTKTSGNHKIKLAIVKLLIRYGLDYFHLKTSRYILRRQLFPLILMSKYTLTFLVDKSSAKNAKNGPIWRVFESLKLAVKQCYQTGQFYLDKKWVIFQTLCKAR